MNENGSNRSQQRMREHLQLLTSQYRDVCCDMSKLWEDVNDGLDLDRLFEETDTTFSYFGLQLKNVSYALQSVSRALEERAEKLKNSSPFELEKSMHTGKGNRKLFGFDNIRLRSSEPANQKDSLIFTCI